MDSVDSQGWELVAARINADLAGPPTPILAVSFQMPSGPSDDLCLDVVYEDHRHYEPMTVSVYGLDDEPQERHLVHLLQQILEGTAFEGMHNLWPPCPRHPDQPHALTPAVPGPAVWACPIDGSAEAKVGELRSSPSTG